MIDYIEMFRLCTYSLSCHVDSLSTPCDVSAMTLRAPETNEEDETSPRALWLGLWAIGIAWGLTGPLSKLAVSTGNHPIGVSFWDALLCALILSAVLVARRQAIALSRRHAAFYLACAVLGTALPNVLSYTAYQHLPVGVMVMILSTVPMMTLAISLPVGVEHVTRRRVVGLGFGVVAVMMIYLPGTSLPDPELAIWVVLPVLVALSYAVENVVIARFRPGDLDPVTIICALSWGATLLLLPAVIYTNAWFSIATFGPPEQAIVGNALLHVGAYVGFVWMIGCAGPVFAAQVGYIVTGTGVILGMIVYGERHSVWVWGALALIVVGLSLVKPRQALSEENG